MCKLGDYCLKRILCWFGIGLELLSACFVAEVCQASKVFRMRKEPLSITLELSKSMRWSNDHSCFAMFDPISTCFGILDMHFLLRRDDNQVVNKPFKPLQREFPSPKFRPSIEHQPNVIYKILCSDCDWYYVGETGRCFETRKKEHQECQRNMC